MSLYSTNIDVTEHFGLVVVIAQRYFGLGAEIEEIIAEGNRGLVYAAENYNGSHKFSTYARHWIKKFINQYINDYLTNARQLLTDVNSQEYLDCIDNHPKRLFEQSVCNMDLREIFSRAKLSGDEQELIAHRFGINTTPKTLKEIGKMKDCTGEWMRLIEAGALEKLKRAARNV